MRWYINAPDLYCKAGMMKANALILLITVSNLLRLGAMRSPEGQPFERAAIHRATIAIKDSAYIKVFRGSLVEDEGKLSALLLSRWEEEMGRARLEIKYREEIRARVNTYKSRMKGMEKKAKELSVLCGVDIMFVSYSPDLNTFNCWPPKESSEFHRIINRLGYSISSQKPPTEVSSPPISSSASQEEEFTAINRKLEEVRQMINFLEAQKKMEYSIGADGCDLCPNGAATSLNEDEEIFSLLEELGEDLCVSDDNVHSDLLY